MIDSLVRCIAWLAPADALTWSRAMRAEITAIPDRRDAFRFAMGCVRAALTLRLRALMRQPTASVILPGAPAPLLAVQTHCGCAAAAIGVLYLVVAEAPLALIAVNVAAVMMGLLLVLTSPRLRYVSSSVATGVVVGIAALLLLTAMLGRAVDGVSRWVMIGGFALHTTLLFLPLAVLLFAQTVNRWTTVAMVAIAGAVALQPDRAMACALGAALLSLLLVRRTPGVARAACAATAAALLTWWRADPLPAVPFVDQILWSGFRLHPLLGVALWFGSALLFIPMLLMRSAAARPACVATGVCWGAVVVASALGAYPTPLVGYGGAAIVGYFLCLAALGVPFIEVPASSATDAPALDAPGTDVDTSHSRVRIQYAHALLLGVLWVVTSGRPVAAQSTRDACARPGVLKVEQPGEWQPGHEGRQIPLWPETHAVQAPETGGRREHVGTGSPLVAGELWHWATYISRPTMTIYEPVARRTGAAMVVLPGGGYAAVAMDLEGTEICDWVTAQGITCAVLKYRVPQAWPRTAAGGLRPPLRQLPLQDAQRAIGLLRAGAARYGLDPRRIGVIGFSAGGHLAAAVSNAERRQYVALDSADRVSSIPDFAILLYPGRLWDSGSRRTGLPLASWVTISRNAPPTLLIHAMNDPVDDVRHSAAYGLALQAVGVPVDMRFYAEGCHAFGIRPTSDPITTEWPDEVVRWLQHRGMLKRTERSW